MADNLPIQMPCLFDNWINWGLLLKLEIGMLSAALRIFCIVSALMAVKTDDSEG